MSIYKRAKDKIIKFMLGKGSVPTELLELSDYFRTNGPIKFHYERRGNQLIAVSKNFRCGSIVTSGKNISELEKNIEDAILTSFDVPSSYAEEAGLHKVGEAKAGSYAFV